MEMPPQFAEEVNRMIFDFAWNHKPAKIKRSTLIKSKKEGGLKMKDFAIFDKALKLNWVNRLCSDLSTLWKYIPTSLLANVGGTFLFQCNYDCKLLCLSEYLPRFYKDIIALWQKITTTDPQNTSEVLEQVIWKNRFLIVNKKLLYFPHWDQAGQSLTYQTYLTQKKITFYLLILFAKKFKRKYNFLQYYSIISAFSRSWKKLLNSNNQLRILAAIFLWKKLVSLTDDILEVIWKLQKPSLYASKIRVEILLRKGICTQANVPTSSDKQQVGNDLQETYQYPE